MSDMNMMMMMMPMHFWKGNNLTWLINGWESSDGGEYFVGLLITFLLAFTVESISYVRNYTYVKA